MKKIFLLISLIVPCSNILIGMDKQRHTKKRNVHSQNQLKKNVQYQQKIPTIPQQEKITHSIAEKLLIECTKHAALFCSTPKELRNWIIPTSLINKYTSNTLNTQCFIRKIISSMAYTYDEYTEEKIAFTINSPSSRKYNTLSSRIFNKNIRLTELEHLINHGADNNYRKENTDYSQASPLLYFIHYQLFEHIKHLLNHRTNIDHYYSVDPITACVSTGNSTILQLLLNSMPKNFDLYYALRCALQKYTESPSAKKHIYKKLLIMLLDAKADATEGLLYAIEYEYFDPFIITTLALRYHADTNEAFKKLIEYTLTNTKASQVVVRTVIATLKQSPNFEQQENIKQLNQRMQRLNTIKNFIN